MQKNTSYIVLLAIIALLASAGLTVPAVASPPAQEANGSVRAVLFWMEGCPHCHDVIDNVLPPLQDRYGDLLEIEFVEVATVEDVDRLLQIAAGFGIPQDQVAVPFLIIGEYVLIGAEQIPAELPGLIERYLSVGGVDYPDLTLGEDNLPFATPVETASPDILSDVSATSNLPVVHLLLFWTSDCYACQVIVAETLPSLKSKYQQQLIIQYQDVVTGKDVDHFYEVAAAFGISKEQADLPLLIIGDRALIGAQQIQAELPKLVERYLKSGGVGLPNVPQMAGLETSGTPKPLEPPDGYGVAIGVMFFMAAGLFYSIIAFLRGKTLLPSLPRVWQDRLFILLALAGTGVALYLAYVETQAVTAACGPIGDCNAVQSGPYSRLFGVLPIGVLGTIGYVAILSGWFYPKLRSDRLAQVAPLMVFGMTFFGVLFSLYLTYLEPFVIRAVCAWCLTSAVIMTLLLLVSLKPALQAMSSGNT